MKLNKIVVAAVALSMVCGISFAAKSKGKMVKDGGQRVRVDWQGRENGKELPKWVESVDEGIDDGVAEALKIDTEQYMIFVAQSRAPDLDFAQVWAKNIEAKQEIANSISQVIANDTEAEMYGKQGKEASAIEKERIYKDATAVATAIELNGLKKAASAWVKTLFLKPGVKAKAGKAYKESEIEDVQYTYYIVYKMLTSDFKKQAEAAMKTVDDNTSEQSYLKRVLAAKVGQSILPGNNIDPAYTKKD